MTLVEKHDFLKGSTEYKELDQLCFLSKNLYNAGLYAVRQHFFATKKFLPYNQLTSQFTETNQSDFRALPAKVAQHTLKLINQNFKASFFDRDFIPDYKPADLVKHKFSGRRKCRGLYQSKKNILNADVNGSLNIMRKFFQYHAEIDEPTYLEQILKCSPKVYTIG